MEEVIIDGVMVKINKSEDYEAEFNFNNENIKVKGRSLNDVKRNAEIIIDILKQYKNKR